MAQRQCLASHPMLHSFLEKCPVKKQRQVVAGLDEVLHVVAST
jgi:hypothetical protein